MIARQWIIILLCIFLSACGSGSETKLEPLPPNATILAFGDSLTFGTGGVTSESYPEQLAKITGFKVINAGVPGEETSQGVERITQELDKYQPQLVILCLGGNDLIRKRPSPQIQANLEKIINVIKANGAQIVLIAVPKFENFSLQVPDFYQELGDEMQVPVELNALPELLSDTDYKSDYIHLNAKGYKKFAEYIAEFLRKRGAIN